MKLHIITIGKPKLTYAQHGWNEYLERLKKLHTVHISHLSDKFEHDSDKLTAAANPRSYRVALVIDGPQLSSGQLAGLLQETELRGQELTLYIGGPDGLPEALITKCDRQMGLSKLTFPHDLAMVILAEALYRASTINRGTPYHH